jgi:hypothetical protein
MSQFDPQTFLDAVLTSPTEKRNLLPPGEYVAVIGQVKSRAWTKKTDPSVTGIAWDVPLTIDIPAEIQDSAQLPPTLTLYGGIMLDITPEGTIDTKPGKNRALYMYREALKLNKPGDEFSARVMEGRLIRVKVTHELYQNDVLEKVSGVTAA